MAYGRITLAHVHTTGKKYTLGENVVFSISTLDVAHFVAVSTFELHIIMQ